MFVALPGLPYMLLSSFILGASNGSRIFLFPIVLIQDFGLANLANCMGFGNFLNGFVSLTRPALVGTLLDAESSQIDLL